MTTRRDFIRQGALFVAAAALIEPRRLWAFPSNPLGASSPIIIRWPHGCRMTECTYPYGVGRYGVGRTWEKGPVRLIRDLYRIGIP